MARVRPSSERDTSTPSATSGVEDLSAKMARLHSPMKDVDDVVTPHVATCVGRTLNMAFSAAPNVTERKSVVRTSAKEANVCSSFCFACCAFSGRTFCRWQRSANATAGTYLDVLCWCLCEMLNLSHSAGGARTCSNAGSLASLSIYNEPLSQVVGRPGLRAIMRWLRAEEQEMM